MKNEFSWEDLPLMLTPAQVGKVLHLNPEMIRTLAKAKTIPSVRITSKFLIPRDTLRDWIEENARVENLRSMHSNVEAKSPAEECEMNYQNISTD